MKWHVITTGKPSFPWTRDGVEMYVTRLQRLANVRVTHLKSGADTAAYAKASGDAFRLVLDERGARMDTQTLYRQVTEWELDGPKEIAVWIGGADGLGAEARQAADFCLKLGELTLMHELALLVWLEQLYRVYTLKGHLPYHRD